MIAVDTNVVLRRLLDDDPAQSQRARRLFEAATPVLVTDVVLAEALWTLQGTRYRASRDDLVAVVIGLLEEPAVVFEDRNAVWSAVNEFADARPVVTAAGVRVLDFADALVVYKAIATAQANAWPYEGTYTFDKAAQALAGARAL